MPAETPFYQSLAVIFAGDSICRNRHIVSLAAKPETLMNGHVESGTFQKLPKNSPERLTLTPTNSHHRLPPTNFKSQIFFVPTGPTQLKS